MKKRLSIFLAVLLVIGCVLPMTAFAATSSPAKDYTGAQGYLDFETDGQVHLSRLAWATADSISVATNSEDPTGFDKGVTISKNTDANFATSGTTSAKISVKDAPEGGRGLNFYLYFPGIGSADTERVITFNVMFTKDIAFEEGVTNPYFGTELSSDGSWGDTGGIGTYKANTWYQVAIKVNYDPWGAASAGWYNIAAPGIMKDAVCYIDDAAIWNASDFTLANGIEATYADDVNAGIDKAIVCELNPVADGGNNGGSGNNNNNNDDKKPGTFDAGVLSFVIMGALGSVGAVLVSKKKRG